MFCVYYSGSDDESHSRSTSTTSELEIDVDPEATVDDDVVSVDVLKDEKSGPEAKWQCFISGVYYYKGLFFVLSIVVMTGTDIWCNILR